MSALPAVLEQGGLAEWALLGLAGLSLPWALGLRVLDGRGWRVAPPVWALPALPMVGLTLAAAWHRAHQVAPRLPEVPAREVPGLVALSVAESASVLWFGALLAAGVLGIGAALMASSRRAGRRDELVALGAPALLLLAVALLAAGDARLHRALLLADPAADLADLPTALRTSRLLGLAAVIPLLALLPLLRRVPAAARERPVTWTLLAVLALGGGGWLAAVGQGRGDALALAPAAALDGLAAELGAPLVHPAADRVANLRVAGGCLLVGDDLEARTIGWLSERHGLLPCEGGTSSRVWLALAAGTPADVLEAAPVRAADQVGLLALHDGPASLERWRWTQVPLAPHEAPVEGARGWRFGAERRPARGSVVVGPAPEGPVVVGPSGRFPADADGLRRATAHSARPDVVLLPSPDWTVDELLATCLAAQPLAPVGMRCVIGTGEAEAWRRWAVEGWRPPSSEPPSLPPLEVEEVGAAEP